MDDSVLRDTWANGRYELPPLPYGGEVPEPLVSAETLRLHYDKHHAAYVAGANAAMETLQLINEGKMSPALAPAATQDLVFNLSGHMLHSLYWENIGAETQTWPRDGMARAIAECFGCYEAFEKLFIAVSLAVKGSGWGVLGMDPVSRRLLVLGIHSHQNVLVPGFCPLLVCDVWEHAYYLTWKNDRKAYLHAFMQQIDWDTVEKRLQKACCHEF